MNHRPVAIGIVAGLILAALMAGCTAGGPSYVKGKFRDADQRIAQAADGGYSQSWQLVVPAGTPALTIRSSFLADQGIAFALRNPSNRLTTSFAFPGPTEMPDMTWVEARRPMPGTWHLSIDCGRRCDFSFGFYLKDAVPRVDADLRAYEDATIRFSEDTHASASRVNAFHIPANASQLSLRFSLDSQEAFSFRLDDPNGQRRASTSFPARAHVDDAQYSVMESPHAGTWILRAECRTGCVYGLGVYLE